MSAEQSETYPKDYIEFTPLELSAIDFWSDIIKKSNTYGFIKGGFLRDKIASKERSLTITPKDIDILVVDRINKVASVAIKNGATIVERRRRKGTPVFRYSHPDFGGIDFEMGVAMGTEYDSASNLSIVRDDVLATDLNVNAISLVLANGIDSISDPLKGVESIKKGEITIVSAESLYKNPEIVLRAIRIADKIECALSQWSLDLISKHAYLIKRMQRPFLLIQIKSIVDSPNAQNMWNVLKEYGVLHFAFPEKPDITVNEVKKMYE